MGKRRIMLACVAGMSTSLLVSKMQKAAQEKNICLLYTSFKNTSCSSCDSVRWGYTVRNGIGGQASHLVIEEAASG